MPDGLPCSGRRCYLARQGGQGLEHVRNVETGNVAPPSAPAEIPPLPPLWRRALTFARAVARHTLDGLRRTAPSTLAARRAACKACDRLRDDGRCGACGCPTAVKTAWRSESCRLGRWPR